MFSLLLFMHFYFHIQHSPQCVFLNGASASEQRGHERRETVPGKCIGDNIISSSSEDSRGSSSKGQQGAVRPLCEMLEAICHAAAGKRRAAKREKAAAIE